ncbi:Bug family tripartite tricarboxylate transporter substrate binding protein [Falsiroseomonas oryzae]|uniref:Bug family tripartite tricarboxylate transporter substrate binding protein n=1 Tax=Falsiroseomonas oryzae TaxID=2766473 RepID=UPI0022EB1F09|nr:tripartite tricarboxylate transporter substrate-binding protein [Roseomonas sp. MO-31]
MLLLPAIARAQARGWQARSPRSVVSFTAGMTTDIIARMAGARLERRWSRPVVIDNRPGAGGNMGTDSAVKAAPEGYTLLIGSVGPLAVNVSLYRCRRSAS